MNPKQISVWGLFMMTLLGVAMPANYCPEGERICGNSIWTNCYNPTTHNCYYGIPCLKHLKPCGTQCYDPNTKFCAGSEVCEKHMSTCYFKCYDPKDPTKKCNKHEYGEVLCDANQKLCNTPSGIKECC